MTTRRRHPRSKSARTVKARRRRTTSKAGKGGRGRHLSAKTRAKIAAALRARAAAKKKTAAAKRPTPKPVRVQTPRPVKPPAVAAMSTNFGVTIAAPTHGAHGARLGVIRAARVRRGRRL
jgi:hypothetical protein